MFVFSLWLWQRHSKIEQGDQPEFDIGLLMGFVFNAAFIFLFFNLDFGLFFYLAIFLEVGLVSSMILTIAGNQSRAFVFGLGYCFVLAGYVLGVSLGFILASVFAVLSFLICLLGIMLGLLFKIGGSIFSKKRHGQPRIIWDY